MISPTPPRAQMISTIRPKVNPTSRSDLYAVNGSSANGALVGCEEPPGGSMVNANAFESPRSDSTAVVDGATAAASIVPADLGPPGRISHIWYTVPAFGGVTLFITSTPAFFARENT